MITIPIMTTAMSPDEVTAAEAVRYIRRHHDYEVPRLAKLESYYDGRHDILDRTKTDSLSNNRLVTNHAAYIANFTSAYLLGQPVAYTSDGDITQLKDALALADSPTQDADLALDAAIYGRAYDMVYMSSDKQPHAKLARLSPLNTFVVYDDTVEQNPVFAVYYYPIYDDSGNVAEYKCSYQTAAVMCGFTLSPSFAVKSVEEPSEHFFGVVPIDEIYNNGQRQGDFEQVLSLIDAYNTLQSDRVNDKEQFVNAFLLIKGVTLGEDNAERVETYEALKNNRVLELPAEGADASYLVRQFDENSVETLRNSIVSDIHKISGVPDMSDESFAGNASGVAMKYKLLNLEEITKTKERFFTEGLRYRLKAIANILGVKGTAVSVSDVSIKFTRSLPANDLEIAQTAATLNGIIPQRNLLSMIPSITDVDAAIKELEEEKADAVKRQQSAFANTPLVAGDTNGEK